MQDRLGENLIAGILAEKKLPNCSIKDTDLNFAARKAFSYIRDYLEQYNQWPLPEDVAEESGITLPVHYPPAEASAEKIRKRALAGAVEKTTKSVIAALNDNDPDRALDYIRKLDENSSKVRAAPYDYTISGADRMEYYLSLQETGGLRGLESPWETINRAAAGFVKGEFIVFAAYYGIGKSWMCCMLSDWFLNQGAKVLLVTMEMPTNKIARRVDAVRHRIPFSALRRSFAGCDPVVIDLWKERMANDRDTENRLLIADKKIVESARDVMDLAREFKPDAVLIDGGYRLHGAGSGRWESMARTIEDLQLFAEATDIPWIVTTQLGNAGDSGKESVKAGKIKAKVRYGQEWLIDPDLVIIMSQTEVQRELAHMELHIHKVREGVADETTPFIVVNWDLDEMKFSEISPESEEEESNELVF